MTTDKRDSIAATILNSLLQLIGVALFYWLLIYTTIRFWYYNFLRTLTHVTYEAGPNFTKELYLLLLIYAVFCYLANRFLLDLYHRKTARQLMISIIADYLIWPLEVFIMIEYKNWHKTSVIADISVIYNIYLITALLIVKNIIAVKI